jgi:large subunit ribosomal protein L22
MEEQREVRAVAKWVRVSPRKARQVVDHIRGRSVPEARTVLAFTDRAAAREVEKVLRSAIANAETNHGLIGDELVVSGAFVDDGLIIKRWRPQARGRVHPIKKRTCHITIKLAAADFAVLPPPVSPPPPEPEAEEPEAAAEEAPVAEEVAAEPQTETEAEEPKAEAEEAEAEEPQAEAEEPQAEAEEPQAEAEEPQAEAEEEEPKRRRRLRRKKNDEEA